MKKVVHLTSVHPRYDQRILWRECFSLRENGYDVTLIVNDAQGDETLNNGIKILSTGLVFNNRLQRMMEGVRRVYEMGLMQNADIYHLHDPELLTIALGLKRQGKKVIFDSHEFYDDLIKTKDDIPLFVRNIVAKSYKLYETFICKQIDGVIVPASYDGKETFLGRANRLAYVNNYPKHSEYEEIVVEDYSTRKNIFYSGSITKNRGITNLIQAAMKAKTTVVLAGRIFPDEYKKEIMNYSNDGGVQYCGLIYDRKNLFEMYAKCAIGVCLLLDVGQFKKMDGFPTKVYEYMAVSLPVIISDFPYNCKMIEKYQFGLVADASNANDIAEKITWLLKHPKEAEEMGKNGKRLLEEQFTWDVSEKELLRLYKEIE